MKRGQGISMNVIIIAAIALLVLVILSVLILRAGGQIGEGTSCMGIEGAFCEDSAVVDADGCGENYIRDITKDCRRSDETCCIPGPLRQSNG